MHMYCSVCVCGPEEGIQFSGSRVKGSCGLPDVGAGTKFGYSGIHIRISYWWNSGAISPSPITVTVIVISGHFSAFQTL